MKLDTAADGETVYTSAHAPDPASARDVLAFVLTRPDQLVAAGDGDLQAVQDLLRSAKAEAVERWQALQRAARG